MSNENNQRDIENNNSQTTENQNQFQIGGYDQKGKYNPWIKKQQEPILQQSMGYSQFDQQTQQSNVSILRRVNFTWKSFSGINLALIWTKFLVVYALAANTENNYSCILYNLGALYQPSITYNYEFQRLILPNFLHDGLIHLFSNCLGLYYFGSILEEHFGTKKFAILYILSGLGGNIFQGYYHPECLSVGASSSIFGFFPLILLYLRQSQNICRQQKIFYSVQINIDGFIQFYWNELNY
ncbi:hypothetical protein ABPG72_013538 [Tetrahymena utriculariae]